jgi:hypothetical protein
MGWQPACYAGMRALRAAVVAAALHWGGMTLFLTVMHLLALR